MKYREQEKISQMTQGFFDEHSKDISEEWVDPNKAEPAATKYRTFYSKTINSEVSYLTYTPPDYDTAEGKRYPVVYWLHGLNGNQRRG
ncbi:MAG: alpha/beta hydrolase-fold protein, partial [Planctomycetota bacterium]